jgi:glycosyltransferase involved in cell wall biosynthesis
MKRVVLVGPVYPYRAGIAHCTTQLAEELSGGCEVHVVSFSKQFPKRFYPGGDDRDPTLIGRTPPGAEFSLSITNPLSWIRTALRIRRSAPDAVIFIWWVWVWALPYLLIRRFLPRKTRVLLQCHNISDKEPSWWKSALTNRVLRSADLLVIHAKTEVEEARRRIGDATEIEHLFLPVHELGGAAMPRDEAKQRFGFAGRRVALFFGHVRPFKALDVALRAWPKLNGDVVLLVAGEVWWNDERRYRDLARELSLDESRVRFDFRFIPDAEVATFFSAADVVLAPYRAEAQSGVVLTAFHFARPVIASNVGGIPEIVEDGVNGFLVPPGDPDALAAAVDRFFSEAASRPSMEEAAAAAALKYSWREFGSRMRALIERELD